MGTVQSTEREQVAEALLHQFSPKLGEFASSLLTRRVEPVVQRSLDSSVSEEVPESPSGRFKFVDLHFGEARPELSHLDVYNDKESDESKDRIVVDFNVDYVGEDARFGVDLLGLSANVTNVVLRGRCRLVLVPVISELPFIGGIQIGLLERPHIDFDIGGAAEIANISFIKNKMKKAVMTDVEKELLFPQRFTLVTSARVDAELTHQTDVAHLLLVQIVAARGLPKKKGLRSLIGQSKPDAYALARVGGAVLRTRVVSNSCDPDFVKDDEEDNNEDEDKKKKKRKNDKGRCLLVPLERLRGHRLDVRLYDDDTLTRDEFMGKVVLNLQDELLPMLSEGDELRLALQSDESEKSKYESVEGELVIRVRHLRVFNADNGDFAPIEWFSNNVVALLQVFVYSCNNFVELDQDWDGDLQKLPTTKLRVRVDEDEVHESEWMPDNPNPQFDLAALFQLRRRHLDNEETSLKVDIRGIEGDVLGERAFPLSDLIARGGMKRRLVQWSPEEKPHLTMTISARVKFVA